MNNLSIDEIIELMEELLDNSSAMPFSSKKMIDCEQMRDYIDNLHLSLPAELEKAKETQPPACAAIRSGQNNPSKIMDERDLKNEDFAEWFKEDIKNR